MQKNNNKEPEGKYLPAICDTAIIALSRGENSITNYTSMPQNTPVAPSYLSFHSSRRIIVKTTGATNRETTVEEIGHRLVSRSSFSSRPYLSKAVIAPEGLGLNKQLNATHRNGKCQGSRPKDKGPAEWGNFGVCFLYGWPVLPS